jgi:hypothetical protein
VPNHGNFGVIGNGDEPQLNITNHKTPNEYANHAPPAVVRHVCVIRYYNKNITVPNTKANHLFICKWLAVYAIDFIELIYTSLMRKRAGPGQR